MGKISLVFILVSLSYHWAYSQEKIIAFEKVWQAVSEKSYAIDSAKSQLSATQKAQERTKLHWTPNLYLSGQSFVTNNPGISFFGTLQQRSLTTADFNPQTINHPGESTFHQVNLGLSLPLYEGGHSTQAQNILSKQVEANEKQVEHTEVLLYSQVVQFYGELAVYQSQQKHINSVYQQIKKIIKNYKVGKKSNPVGYSGLLGLESLLHKAEGLLTFYQQQSLAIRQSFTEMGLKENTPWQTHTQKTPHFLARTMGAQKSDNSPFIEQLKKQAQVAQIGADAELARFRPHIGLFAEGTHFTGDRTSADGYTAGLYLKWHLWSHKNYGKHSEALLKAKVADNFAKAQQQQQNTQRQGLKHALIALRKQRELLVKSQILLTEQTQVADRLFRNGSINALQLSEVFNRQVDLIQNFTELEVNLISYSTKNMRLQKFDIPTISQGGN